MPHSNNAAPSHPLIRAFLAGIGLPVIAVSVVGVVTALIFDQLAPSVQRAVLVPLSVNPVIWGLWNVLWVAAGARRLPIAWHGTVLGFLLVGIGVVAAPLMDVSAVTPWRGFIALLPIAVAYHLLWRWGVMFLNVLLAVES
jgi:hypothetical protein